MYIAFIVVGVVILIGLVAFLMRKFIPGLKGDEKKASRKEIAEQNLAQLIVDPEHDEAAKSEKEAEKRKAIKKIRRESLNEQEEEKRLGEILDEDGDDELLD